MKIIVFLLSIFIQCGYAISQEKTQDLSAAAADTDDPATALSSFGFGPAFYMISYNDEILADSKDVRVRGDGDIDSSGSKFGTALGLEVHYDISVKGWRNGYLDANKKTVWTKSSGFIVSPFLGVYDIDNGINGLAAGVLFGYWTGDKNFENRTSLNFGIGYTVHRNQLVLSNKVVEGSPPPTGLETTDFTTRKDVTGIIALVSVSVDF